MIHHHASKWMCQATKSSATLLAICAFLISPLSACGSSSANNQTGGESTSSQTSSSSSSSTPSSPSTGGKGSSSPQSKGSEGQGKSSTSARPSNPKGGHAATAGECSSDELSAKLTFGSGSGAGSSYPYLVLTNTGSRSCTVRGYAGVSLLAKGKQIGAAATMDSSVSPTTVRLQPGQSAHAELRIVHADLFDSSACSPITADTLMVYPPDQTKALTIPLKGKGYIGCSNPNTKILTVRPFQRGER